MPEVFVSGHTGMLGKAVVHEANLRNYSVETIDFSNLNFPGAATVINCAGAIPLGKRQDEQMVYSNAMLPYHLMRACEATGARLIQVSTDCVFSGEGFRAHAISEIPDPVDIYGVSKRLGELVTRYKNARVVRTSFIGLEHGLIPWLLGAVEAKQSVEGYIRATWTGSTVWEVARGLLDMVEDFPEEMVHHLATERVWNKCEVLERISSVMYLDAVILPVLNPIINRGLKSTLPLADLNDPAVSLELWGKYNFWQK